MKKVKKICKIFLVITLCMSSVMCNVITVLGADDVNSNLALNKPVTASGYEAASTVPGNAVDGNKITRWGTGANKAVNEWIEVDLEAEYNIKQINLLFERADAGQNILSYQIEAYREGAYSIIYSTDTKAKQLEKIVFNEKQAAEKIKVTILQANGGTINWVNVGVNEIEIFEEEALTLENVALSKPVTGPGAAANITDGNISNYCDLGAIPGTFTIDLEDYYEIDEIIAVPYFSGGRNYKYYIEASVDDITYTKIGEKLDDAAATAAGKSFEFDEELIARYIRVTMTHNSANPSAHMNEMLVYGKKAEDYTPPADFSELNALIAEGNAKVEEAYTGASWSIFAAALASANAVSENSDATQTEVDAAKTTLQAAINGLVPRANFSELNALIAEGESKEEEAYTGASWSALTAALTTATAVSSNSNATQVGVDAAKTALQAAINGLVPRANFSELNALIAEGENKEEAAYTSESWSVLTAALATATAISNNSNAAQGEVDAAEAALQAVINGLVPRADFSELNALIAEGESKEEEAYTSGSWSAFTAALESANTVSDDNNATQAEVNTAKAALQDAINGLVLLTDFSELNALIDEGEAKEEETYTGESWSTFAAALASAATVSNNSNATQAEVDAAEAALQDAINGLVPRADFSELNALIAAGESKEEEAYTSGSWSAFAAALESANTVSDDNNATQAEVNAAKATLQDAINGLVLLTDFSELNALIAEGESKEEATYTGESWSAFAGALASAATVSNNSNATQGEVDAAEAALQAAIDGLVSRADFSELNALIAEGESKEEEAYTSGSWSAFAAALDSANTVSGDNNATQAEVNSAAAILSDAMNTLVEVQPEGINTGELVKNPSDDGKEDDNKGDDSKGNNAKGNDGKKSPATGDTQKVGWYIGGLILSLAAVLYIIKRRRKTAR